MKNSVDTMGISHFGEVQFDAFIRKTDTNSDIKINLGTKMSL